MGSGKSTLTATAIQNLVNKDSLEDHPAFHLAYHFCDGTLQQSQTQAYTKSILGSLLRQLCQLAPRDISTSLARRVVDDQRGPLSIDEYEGFLLDSLENHPAIIVIDAFDELPSESRNVLMKILKRFKSKIAALKLFISSRTTHKLEKMLKISKTIEVRNQLDIQMYIQRKIEAFIEFRDELKIRFNLSRLQEVLQRKASGM